MRKVSWKWKLPCCMLWLSSDNGKENGNYHLGFSSCLNIHQHIGHLIYVLGLITRLMEYAHWGLLKGRLCFVGGYAGVLKMLHNVLGFRVKVV